MALPIFITSLILCEKSLPNEQFALNFSDAMTLPTFCAKQLLKAKFAHNFGDIDLFT